MKPKLTILAILFLCNIFLVQTQTVTTPKGKSIYVFTQAEMSATDIAASNSSATGTYKQATLISNSSNTYNCHSYAWNMIENGPTCWMNYTDLHWYWDDGSYVLTTSENAQKIHYNTGDHSAIKSSVAGMYESKWGQGPVMRHSPTYGPSIYNMTYRNHYNIIVGPSIVCPSGTSFSVPNTLTGISWTKSSNIALSTTSGTSITASSAAGYASASGWISISKSGREVSRFNVEVGGQVIGGIINGSQTLNGFNVVSGSPVSVSVSYPGATNCVWTLISDSSGSISWGYYGFGTIGFYLPSSHTATFRATITSPCGTISSDYTFLMQ